MAKKAKPAKKPPARASYSRYGILNHLGGVWTLETFNTEEAAAAYIAKQSKHYEGGLPKHKVVPVSVTVTVRSTQRRSERG
jgi:hypothetical protein